MRMMVVVMMMRMVVVMVMRMMVGHEQAEVG